MSEETVPPEATSSGVITTPGGARRRAPPPPGVFVDEDQAPSLRPLEEPSAPSSPETGASPPGSDDAATMIGPYRVLTPIGEGGMGRVVLAHDAHLERNVALKLLPPEDADDEGRARFLREARALARVDHANVVQVFASGTDADIAWMALEYVEGDSLSELLEGGPLDEVTALDLAAQAAKGLAAVHEMDIVHRDVKPSNLLLDDEGVLRVLDFGVALINDAGGRGGFVTRKGVAVGTPHFMAPEQARGDNLDSRVDAWGLGATLFAMLTGVPPFYVDEDEADLEILARVLREPIPDVRTLAPVTDATATILSRLLARDPDARIESMLDIATLLEDAADAADRGAPAEKIASTSDANRVKQPTTRSDLPSTVAPAVEPRTAAPTTPPSPLARPLVREAPPSTTPVRAALLVAVALLLSGAFIAIAFAGGNPNPAPELPLEPTLVEQATPDVTRPLSLSLGGAPTATPAVNDVAVEAVPVPSAELVALIREGGEAGGRALHELMARTDDKSTAALLALVVEVGPLGDAVFERLKRAPTRKNRAAFLEAALQNAPLPRQLAAVGALVDLRNVAAIEALDRAARGHRSERVRKAALRARRSLFTVEGED